MVAFSQTPPNPSSFRVKSVEKWKLMNAWWFNGGMYLSNLSTQSDMSRILNYDSITGEIGYVYIPPYTAGRGLTLNSNIFRADTSTFWNFTYSGIASQPAIRIKGTPFSGTATTSTPLFLMQETATSAATTWATAGTYHGINSRSGFTGNIFDYKQNNSALLTLNYQGTLTFGGSWTINSSGNAYLNNVLGFTKCSAPTWEFSGASIMTSPSDGVIKMATQNGTSFTRLQFGGTTTSFPALQRNGTKFSAVLADGSALTNIGVKDSIYASSWNGNNDIPTKNAIYDKIQTMGTVTNVTGTAPIVVATGTSTPSISMKKASSTDSGWVSTGTQTFAGNKTFSGTVYVPTLRASTNVITVDTVYGSNWNGNNSVPTKNAVYDKIEGMNIAYGSSTPTVGSYLDLTSVTQITYSYLQKYTRTGNVVTVSGSCVPQFTTTGVLSSFEVSIPVSSNMSTSTDVSGIADCQQFTGQISKGDNANYVQFTFPSATVISGQIGCHYTFSYIVD